MTVSVTGIIVIIYVAVRTFGYHIGEITFLAGQVFTACIIDRFRDLIIALGAALHHMVRRLSHIGHYGILEYPSIIIVHFI